ncbi:hypothetical protein GQ53DRAFT_471785 [Thozetella sp. PMI_491]|nr:hypothetical protein GQ53DRAFT_471785 [Thozetella sp. PMI_491]
MTMDVASTPAEPEPSVDPNGSPWDMPGHSVGEAFATWATFFAVFGLILSVMILDFCRKQRGHEMITKKVFRRCWNGTLGRIDRFHMEEPDIYSDAEKGKKTSQTRDDSSSEEVTPPPATYNPGITITQPLSKINAAQLFQSAPSCHPVPPPRVSEDRPGSRWSSMLEPNPSGHVATRIWDDRPHSNYSNVSQLSGERRVAQPVPGRMLTDRQI